MTRSEYGKLKRARETVEERAERLRKMREYYVLNKEKMNATSKEWAEKNPERVKYAGKMVTNRRILKRRQLSKSMKSQVERFLARGKSVIDIAFALSCPVSNVLRIKEEMK